MKTSAKHFGLVAVP